MSVSFSWSLPVMFVIRFATTAGSSASDQVLGTWQYGLGHPNQAPPVSEQQNSMSLNLFERLSRCVLFKTEYEISTTSNLRLKTKIIIFIVIANLCTVYCL